MLGSILLFLLFILLAGVLFVIFMVRHLLHQSGLDRIFAAMRGRQSHDSSRNEGHAQQREQPHRHTSTASGEVIIDQRPPEQVDQKIFDKTEGEYVDYQEE